MRFNLAKRGLFVLTIIFMFSVSVFAENRLNSSVRFLDRDLLAETALKDETAAVRQAESERDRAQDALAIAEAKLVEAEASGDPDAVDEATRNRNEARDEYELAVAGLNDAISAQETEAERVGKALEGMSDAQVVAMNRSLNNARHNRFGVDLDAEHLEAVGEGSYNDRQIMALTKALEEEAKFNAHAERFLARYEATGNEKFMDKAERFESRGAAQKEKFLSKIERFGEMDAPTSQETESPKSVSADMQKEVRKNSRTVARNSARESAQKLARESVREASRNEKREANRGQGKGKLK